MRRPRATAPGATDGRRPIERADTVAEIPNTLCTGVGVRLGGADVVLA